MGKELTIQEIDTVGMRFFNSGMFPIKNAEQAFTKIMAGRELGIEPYAAINGINIIQGKPELGVHLLAGVIKSSGKYNYKIIKSDDQECHLEYFENGESIGNSVFNLEHAKKANLLHKDNWKKYTEEMLYARAMAKGARKYCPDLFIGGVYVDDEISDSIQEPINITKGTQDLGLATEYDTALIARIIDKANQLKTSRYDPFLTWIIKEYDVHHDKLEDMLYAINSPKLHGIEAKLNEALSEKPKTGGKPIIESTTLPDYSKLDIKEARELALLALNKCNDQEKNDLVDPLLDRFGVDAQIEPDKMELDQVIYMLELFNKMDKIQ